MNKKIYPGFFSYTNSRKKVYFLHKKISKKGSISYYFSPKNEGDIVKEIPEGYEVWESPVSTQVFLRKQEICLITKEEEKVIEDALEKLCPIHAKFDIRGRQIIIYGSSAKKGFSFLLQQLLPGGIIPKDVEKIVAENSNYQPLFRFTLVDNAKRIFCAERWCFKGTIDDWICLFQFQILHKLCEELFPHLGQESFYDLI